MLKLYKISGGLSLFTIIEIIVAVIIVGIVLGFAAPTYKSYVNKNRIVSALTALSDLETAGKDQYETNPTASSLILNDITFKNGIITAYESPPVVNGSYIPPGGNSHVGTKSFLVCIYVGKLNFPGYVAPTPGSAGTRSRICKQVTATTNAFSNKCGALQGNDSDIPAEYLPFGCNCANIWGGSC